MHASILITAEQLAKKYDAALQMEGTMSQALPQHRLCNVRQPTDTVQHDSSD